MSQPPRDRLEQNVEIGQVCHIEHEGHWFTGYIGHIKEPGAVLADDKNQLHQEAGQIRIIFEIIQPFLPGQQIPSLMVFPGVHRRLPNPWMLKPEPKPQ